jgi:hypothetical protein
MLASAAWEVHPVMKIRTPVSDDEFSSETR